jgi:hypothetical protein
MQILKRTLAAALVVVATAGAAVAQTKAPDFSGQWELNVAKSDFGPMAQQAPSKATMTVTQSASSLKFSQALSTPMGDQSNSQEFALDGQEHTANGADGQPVASTAKIDSGAFVIASKLQRMGADITMNSRWTLSPDGKLLTIDRQIGTPQGAFAMKLVYDKK